MSSGDKRDPVLSFSHSENKETAPRQNRAYESHRSQGKEETYYNLV